MAEVWMCVVLWPTSASKKQIPGGEERGAMLVLEPRIHPILALDQARKELAEI